MREILWFETSSILFQSVTARLCRVIGNLKSTWTISAFIGPASAANRAATFKQLNRTRAEHPACLHVFAKTRVRLSTSVYQDVRMLRTIYLE
jgi:hypothetical protein